MKLGGGTAFVTGGTGFIGSRLIEVLTGQYGMAVRALVRNNNSAASSYRIAGCGAEIVQGDLTDVEAMTSAIAGCDYVFHCAFGTSGDPATDRHVTIDGTASLGRAAAANRVRRFVNLSTMVVFGETPAEADESFEPRRMWKWPYAHHKLAAERALQEEHRKSGLSVKTLRLGTVYGPWGTAFTYYPIAALKSGRVVLVDEGRGISNAVYVDDVIQAMILAAEAAGPEPDTFIVKGPDSVPWKAFYEAYEAMLGFSSTTSMSLREVRAHKAKMQRDAILGAAPSAIRVLKADPGFKFLAGQLPLAKGAWRLVGSRFAKREAPGPALATGGGQAPGGRLIPLPDMMWGYYASRTEFSIRRARDVLGFAPQFTMQAGMYLTRQWAEWAQLIPAR